MADDVISSLPAGHILAQLVTLDSPSGDEDLLADWLTTHLADEPAIAIERLGGSVIAIKGEQPKVAIFAHIDTTGFTLGYSGRLIPIGEPEIKAGGLLRCVNTRSTCHRVKQTPGGGWKLGAAKSLEPGSRLVFADEVDFGGKVIAGPYLDNRVGVWAALHALAECRQVAVAFTASEEQSGSGALICARRLYERFGVTQAIISDVTWHTRHVAAGDGPAISLRDSSVPRRRYLTRILEIADRSGIGFQREIEAHGGSDGASLEKSGVPMDWAFIGAPVKRAHSSREEALIEDIGRMAELLAFAAQALSQT